MTDDIGDFDKIDEALMTYDLSDDAVEAAVRVSDSESTACAFAMTSTAACLPPASWSCRQTAHLAGRRGTTARG
jgi:hypothetical protein